MSDRPLSKLTAAAGSNDVAAELRSQFMERYSHLFGAYRYVETKYRHLLGDMWEQVKQLAQGREILAIPHYFEIHPSEPCQLNCKFCRGGLRDVPERQTMMTRQHLLEMLDGIYSLNPKAFIRFSGSIGEPLLHPNILESFEKTSMLQLPWGLTTNGLLLHKSGVAEALLDARFTHISLDAGSDITYQKLKEGRPGDFDKVLRNIEWLARFRTVSSSPLEIVVSVVLQSENFREVPALSKQLKSIGVDTLEIKMQHFDERRIMGCSQVEAAYHLISTIRRLDEGEDYKIVEVQNEQEAILKTRRASRPVDFPSCFANRLGFSTTIDPRGNVQTCCQYNQSTLGIQGHVKEGISAIWNSEQRQHILQKEPRNQCVNCSPSDEFINQFVEFLRQAYQQDSSFLAWVEESFVNPASSCSGGQQTKQ